MGKNSHNNGSDYGRSKKSGSYCHVGPSDSDSKSRITGPVSKPRQRVRKSKS